MKRAIVTGLVLVALALGAFVLTLPGPMTAEASALMPVSGIELAYPHMAMYGLSTAALSANTLYPGELHGLWTFYYEWTSDASGDASITATRPTPGWLFELYTEPGVTAAPTANYDIVVYEAVPVGEHDDQADFVIVDDLTGGGGANRSATVIEKVEFWDRNSAAEPVSGRIHIQISNAGNAKTGVVYLTVLRP